MCSSRIRFFDEPLQSYLKGAAEHGDLAVVARAPRGALLLGEAAPVLRKALEGVEVEPLQK